MSFILPAKPIKEVNAQTKARYERYLNALAFQGYDTPGKLTRSAKKVIAYINNEYQAPATKKVVLSAIFYALNGKSSIPYYTEYQKYKTAITPPN
jgi:hypothetical protein